MCIRDRHNIVTGPNYEELFKDIFQNKRLPSEMIFYLHMPPDNNPSHKSEEKTTFHVMVPVPNLEADINWAAAGKRYRDQIILFLEENYLPDLRSNIVVEHYLTPEYFLKELNCPLGSPFSFQPQLFQSGWFRPHNRSSIIPNLFFVGSGTHPGSGIPSVLTSAKIVDNMIGG